MSPDDAPPVDDSPSDAPSTDNSRPDDRSSLSRRQLLGLVGGAGAVGGIGWFRPTWLPDPITDWLTTVYPNPPAHVWRPAVSDAHADEAVARLERTVERAQTLKERVDVDSVPRELEFSLDHGDPSGGWLESARSASDAHERLRYATVGLSFAGEAVGAAKFVLDEADPERLADRGRAIQSSAEAVLDSVGDYAVSDPSRDLAYLYFVERDLAFARFESRYRKRFDGETTTAGDDFTGGAVADAHATYLQAEQRLANARYYRDRYRAGLGDEARSYADALDSALTTLTESIATFPTASEVRDRLSDEHDSDRQTPYGAARWELLSICFDSDYRLNYGPEGHRHGHTVQRVVEAAVALLGRRGREFALDELGVSPGDTGYDSGRTFRAKRRAVRRFRSVRDEYDSPFAGVLAQDAANLIHAGEVAIEFADGTFPMWRNRVDATTYYLVGESEMRELGEVYGTIVDGS
ncbi:hypothetical protein [Haloferax sulfurifontis]|uniref:Tat (Twin-arginine translocation) pathway signal sequence domain-containing protein n=1 Tax=Haloferax sulfurifontis ATCC BAA-897 TaxID=662480 RepID=M0IR62_9EURY|nr:hypothetical protein [Haloferax sulfurifontis]ELZ99351.1 Tat (twin-arginine translocation) pathway signal sequence domain-containing protein [Haloferax sulfurifontis ATCC BAA-897]